MVATVGQPNLSATSKPSSRLEALARVASELELVPLASEVRAFAERVALGRFYVACVEQFKRGKSPLLNPLLTEPVLPAGVVAVTSVVTIVRYWLSGVVQRLTDHTFPTRTLAVNVSGSLVIGLVMTLSLERGLLDEDLRILRTNGFCGGFTTMSTFSYETLALLRDGEQLLALGKRRRHVCRMPGRCMDRKHPRATTVRTL